jgi:hypothetical protein
MVSFLSYFGMIVSLAGVGYLIVRALPRVKNLPPMAEIPEVGIRAAAKEIGEWLRLKQWQTTLMEMLTRLLHRSRVLTLKTDNRLSGWLERIKNRSRLVSVLPRAWIAERRLAKPVEPRISFATLAEEKWKHDEEELLGRVKASPRDPAVYLALAELYEKMGNIEDAHEARLTAEKFASRNQSKNGNISALSS